MVNLPTVDTEKLKTGALNYVKQKVYDIISAPFGWLKDAAEFAKNLGYDAFGGITDKITGGFNSLMKTIGLAPDEPAPVAAPATTQPPASAPQVTPPATPTTAKPPRSR